MDEEKDAQQRGGRRSSGPRRPGGGYGVRTRTWQGLLVTALVVLVVVLLKSGTSSGTAFLGVIPILVMAAAVFVVRRR